MSAPNEGRQSPPPEEQSNAQAGKTAGGKVSQNSAWPHLSECITQPAQIVAGVRPRLFLKYKSTRPVWHSY